MAYNPDDILTDDQCLQARKTVALLGDLSSKLVDESTDAAREALEEALFEHYVAKASRMITVGQDADVLRLVAIGLRHEDEF